MKLVDITNVMQFNRDKVVVRDAATREEVYSGKISEIPDDIAKSAVCTIEPLKAGTLLAVVVLLEKRKPK